MPVEQALLPLVIEIMLELSLKPQKMAIYTSDIRQISELFVLPLMDLKYILLPTASLSFMMIDLS